MYIVNVWSVPALRGGMSRIRGLGGSTVLGGGMGVPNLGAMSCPDSVHRPLLQGLMSRLETAYETKHAG